MTNVIQKVVGATPKPVGDGSFSPSPLALKLATSDVTDYEKISYGSLNSSGWFLRV